MIMGCKLYLANCCIFLAQFQLSEILLSLPNSPINYVSFDVRVELLSASFAAASLCFCSLLV